MLPGTLLYVYYGKAAGSLAAVAGGAKTEKGTGYWVVLGVGLVATIVGHHLRHPAGRPGAAPADRRGGLGEDRHA